MRHTSSKPKPAGIASTGTGVSVLPNTRLRGGAVEGMASVLQKMLLGGAILLTSASHIIPFPVLASTLGVISFLAFARYPRLWRVPASAAAFFFLLFVSTVSAGTGLAGVVSVGVLLVSYAAGHASGIAMEFDELARVGARWIALVAAVSILLGLAAPAIGFHPDGFGGALGALRGPYVHRNTLAAVLSLGVVLLTVTGPRASPGWRGRRLSWAIVTLALAMTGSATGLVLAGAVLAIRVGHRRYANAERRTRAAMVCAGVMALGVTWLAFGRLQSMLLQLVGRDETLSGRATIWPYAIELWQTSPFTGIGHGALGRFEELFGTRIDRLAWIEYRLHNGFLQVLVELGVVGAVVFGVFVMSSFRRMRHVGPVAPEFVRAALIALVVLFLARNAVESSIAGPLLVGMGVVDGSCRRLGARPASRMAGTERSGDMGRPSSMQSLEWEGRNGQPTCDVDGGGVYSSSRGGGTPAD